MTLCLGPTGSGKTLLLKKLQNIDNVDITASSVPTVGTNIFTLKIDCQVHTIREVGGVMSPLWSKYFVGVKKIMYVVDASNLCQISAAGVLLYEIVAHPLLANAKVNIFINVSWAQFIFPIILILRSRASLMVDNIKHWKLILTVV